MEMLESEGEIEYLEEDAEIVQQCFQPQNVLQTASKPVSILERPDSSLLTERPSNNSLLVEVPPLLVERPVKRRRIKTDDDSDYNPDEDIAPISPPSPKSKKKKIVTYKKRSKLETPTSFKPKKDEKGPFTEPIKKNRLSLAEEKTIFRKQLNIKIPDYDDPLCLPVKAYRQDNSDIKRLDVWNSACIEHFRHCDTMLKPETGNTHSSFRTIVMRKVPNKQTGKVETTIWSKASVQNQDGDKKSEIFQCVLPRYREKKKVTNFDFVQKKPGPRSRGTTDITILTKEKHKDSEALVVYKPKDCISAVYMLFGQNNNDPDDDITDRDDSKMYIKEMTCCKVCADCYQKSWRGAKKSDKKALKCPVCGRTCVTVYNLLSHLKMHSANDVKRYKTTINALLAEILDYHYKCRICQEKFTCIKNLKHHLKIHKAEKEFLCEVGNHNTR